MIIDIEIKAYFCPLNVSYFLHVNMQNKYVNMQAIYVNMQLIYDNMQGKN